LAAISEPAFGNAIASNDDKARSGSAAHAANVIPLVYACVFAPIGVEAHTHPSITAGQVRANIASTQGISAMHACRNTILTTDIIKRRYRVMLLVIAWACTGNHNDDQEDDGSGGWLQRDSSFLKATLVACCLVEIDTLKKEQKEVILKPLIIKGLRQRPPQCCFCGCP